MLLLKRKVHGHPVVAKTACGRQLSAATLVPATCLAAEPTPALSPARGQAIPECIVTSRPHHIGNSATYAGNLVDTVEGLYVGNVMYILDVAWRGEAPGAAPSRRQRGPRT